MLSTSSVLTKKATGQTTTTIRKLMDGKLRLETRNGNPTIYARTYLQGKSLVYRTRETRIQQAEKVAIDWWFGLRDRINRGEHLHGRLFADSVDGFLKHADKVGEVSEGQRRNYRQKWNLFEGYFEGVKVTDVDASFLMTLRKDRTDGPLKKNGKPATDATGTHAADATAKKKPWKRPSNATLKKDMDFVRLVLKYAQEWEKCIDSIPQFPSFRGRTWKVIANPRPFLTYPEWQKVRARARDRALESGLNPRTQRQRQELYCFLLICVGGALRVDEAHSLRWLDCQLETLNDADKTEAVHMMVFGKHSPLTGKREEAYALYEGVMGFKLLQSLRPTAKPTDPLFLEKHRDGMRELLIDADLRLNADGISRDSKSLRQTGMSMRLDLGPSPDYRDIAKWARTGVGQIGKFYDQTHPKASVERVTGFRKVPKKTPRNAKERARMKNSAKTLAKLQKVVREQQERDRDSALVPWETADGNMKSPAPTNAIEKSARSKRRL